MRRDLLILDRGSASGTRVGGRRTTVGASGFDCGAQFCDLGVPIRGVDCVFHVVHRAGHDFSER